MYETVTFDETDVVDSDQRNRQVLTSLSMFLSRRTRTHIWKWWCILAGLAKQQILTDSQIWRVPSNVITGEQAHKTNNVHLASTCRRKNVERYHSGWRRRWTQHSSAVMPTLDGIWKAHGVTTINTVVSAIMGGSSTTQTVMGGRGVAACVPSAKRGNYCFFSN